MGTLATDLRENTYPPLSVLVAVGLLYMAFTMLRYVPSIPNLYVLFF